jgi:hypothetical protein
VSAVHEVASIEEAVELAYTFKDKGQYNWFRGQTQDWPPISSLARLYSSQDPERIKIFQQQVGMFFAWLNSTPDLQYLRQPEHVHDVFAIMQHYGIPTFYIDFTTDPGVAGFFAADTKTPPNQGKSCIYCLDTADLVGLWNALKQLEERKGASIEVVQIDVQNLWRLQSQSGVFLYANYNWHVDYPMDKIVFPYSDYPSYPPHSQIYPKDKSPLEQRLDQYFSLEQSTFAQQRMQKIIDEITAKGGSAEHFEWLEFPEGFYAEAFVNPGHFPLLPSWNDATLKAWEVGATENYYQSIGPTLPLKIKADANVDVFTNALRFAVKQVLRVNPSIRSKTVNWSFSGLPESLSEEKLNEKLRPVWNGMRRLPFSGTEIADALAAVAALLMLGFADQSSTDAQVAIFSQHFGDSLTVGFSNPDGSGSRGIASRQSLHAALRKDMAELLTPKFKDYPNDIYELFKVIYNPKLMFEFEEFKGMFAREVIPAQALWERQPILFNPAQLQIFGLP